MRGDLDRELHAEEREVLRYLKTPVQIQRFLDSVPYASEGRYRCPLTFLRDRKGHCFDGAVFAAAALRRIGHRPRLTDLIPNDRDDDHVLALYQVSGHWGAVAKSNYAGLRFREPVYRSLRELVMSYFESYFNHSLERTLRGYTAPLDLDTLAAQMWEVRDEGMDVIAERLDRRHQCRLLTPAMVRRLTRLDARSYEAGTVGTIRDELGRPLE